MKNLKITLGLITLLTICFGITTFAHQPKIENGTATTVSDPEISKAYYATISDEPDVYTIKSETPFLLYANLLVPDIPNQTKNFQMAIVKDADELDLDHPIDESSVLYMFDGANYEWEKYFEEFGHDNYWRGAEFESEVEAGTYQIIVSSPNDGAKYSLATGKIEYFSFWDTLSTYKTIPNLKRNFFEKSPIDFIYSPLGWGLIIVSFFLSFVFGFIYRIIIKKFAKNSIRKRHKNIGTMDRLVRFGLAIGLFILAITTTRSPILLFLSGFTLFEAIFSWCGLYAALGKNSCPL